MAARVSAFVFNRPYWNVNAGGLGLARRHPRVFNRPYWNVNLNVRGLPSAYLTGL